MKIAYCLDTNGTMNIHKVGCSDLKKSRNYGESHVIEVSSIKDFIREEKEAMAREMECEPEDIEIVVHNCAKNLKETMTKQEKFREIVLEERKRIAEALVPAMAKKPLISIKQVALKIPAILEFEDYHEISSLADSLKGTGLYIKEIDFYEGQYHGVLYTKEVKGSPELKQLLKYKNINLYYK